MDVFTPQSQPSAIELHYWFRDDSHQMDAFIQNRPEYEFLGIVKEVSKAFETLIIVETEPLDEGGLKRIFKIISKNEHKKGVIFTAIIISLTTSILVTPITTAISEVSKSVIERIFKDEERNVLEKEKLRQEIRNLKIDADTKQQKLDQNYVVVKKRSNFYEGLAKYDKVRKISISIKDRLESPISETYYIDRKSFKRYVLVTDELEPQQIENAIIEIVSPVLKKGNYKWRGIYNGEVISFNMKSKEFKTLVQSGQIEFKNGSSINCLLEIKSKINNEGARYVTSYDIIRVNSYFENEKSIETQEGKKYRRKIEADNKQLKLFDDYNLEN